MEAARKGEDREGRRCNGGGGLGRRERGEGG